MKYELSVSGMHCKSCVALVTEVLEEKGVSKVKIVLDEKKQVGKIICEYAGSKNDLVKVIEQEGYTVK